MEVHDSNSLRFQPNLNSEPVLLKMRCPSCSKLYSVEPQSLTSPSLRFECVDCKCQFEAKRSASYDVTILETLQLPAPAFEKPRMPTHEVPLSALSVRECPKCQTPTSFTATDCLKCGVIFAKYKAPVKIVEGVVGEIRVDGRRDIVELWDDVLENYWDSSRHDAFVTACFDADLLAFASQKYARILTASPSDEMAREMRRKIIALASFKTEPRPRGLSPRFRVPKFNNLILVFGGAVLTMGQMLPNMKNLTGIGIAAIALALGVRFFLQRPSTR